MARTRSTHVDDPRAAGERLRDARVRAGLSQRELAFPGCSPAYISRIEAGERTPSLQLLRELAHRLEVDEEYLATGERKAAETDAWAEADGALRFDDLDLARQLYERALEEARDSASRARALAGLGQLAFRSGDPEGAIERIEEAVATWNELLAQQPTTAETVGRAYATVGELEQAIAVFERSLREADERRDPVERLRFAVLLSNALIDSGNFGRAQALLGDVLSQAEGLTDPLQLARVYWSQSRLHALRHEPSPAARYARKALAILERSEETYLLALAHQLLAYAELEGERPEEALSLLQRARELLGGHANRIDLARINVEEARALAQLGRLEEARALVMENSGVLAETDPHDAGRAYAVLADVFDQAGDTPRAQELYELAAELLEGQANPYVADVYRRLGEILERQGRTEEALEFLKKALDAQAANRAGASFLRRSS